MSSSWLFGGAGRAFLFRALGAGLSFGVGVLVARRLGPEGAGLYFLAVTIATIASVVGRLGLDALVVRRVAAARAAARNDELAATARAALRLATCGSALMALLLFASSGLIERHALRLEGLGSVLRWTALAVVPISLLMVTGELLRGLARAGLSQLVQVGLPPAATLVCLALAGQLFGWRPPQAAGAYAAGSAVAALLACCSWRASTSWLRSAPTRGVLRELARQARPFLVVALMTLALPWISTLSLALVGDSQGIGIFSVAYRAATLTSFVLIAVNCVAAPRFAALAAAGQHAELARNARQATLLMALCALPLLLVFWLFPARIMGLFGQGFEQGARCLAILATGQFVNVLTGSVGQLLLMSGHERAMRGNLLLAVLLSIVLHTLWVPSLGAEGAALASATTLAVLNLSSLLLVRRHLSIDVLPLPRALRSDA